MKNQVIKDLKEYINLIDKKYEKDLIAEHGSDFKYIFEIATNYVIYPNYKEEHDKGYLTDSYNEDVDYDFICDILNPLDYNELMESSYGWENSNEPIFTVDELSDILKTSKFIDTCTGLNVPFMDEEDIQEEIENKSDNDILPGYSYTLERCARFVKIELEELKEV